MATVTTHPNGNGSDQAWDVTDYTNVDDGDEQPTSPSDGNTCNVSGLGGPEDCEWVTANPSVSGTASNVSLWVYVSAGALTSVNVKVDGTWQTTNTTIATSSGDWDRYDFSITDNLASITDNQIRVTTNSAATVDGAYLEWTYSPSGSIPLLMAHYDEEAAMFNGGETV